MKNVRLGFGLTASLLLLAACGTSIEAIEEARGELLTEVKNVSKQNEQIHNLEVQMDEQFTNVLAEDEDLTTLADESAAVYQNIINRENLLNEYTNQIDNINEQVAIFEEYDGTDLPEALTNELSTQFLEFTEALENHAQTYQESLTVQKDYLANIATEDANYDNFSTGIDTVNENYATTQEARILLDKELVNTHAILDKLKETIAEVDPEAVQETDIENLEDNEGELVYLRTNDNPLLTIPDTFPQKFIYESGVDIAYPEDGVKGIYVTAHSAGGQRMDTLVDLLNTTDLNSMVIDVKDDYGNVTLELDSEHELVNEMTNKIINPDELMPLLEENDIYPIARIVLFKDTHLAEARPEWSFTRPDGSIWKNNRGEAFVNPYLKEVWDYNIEVAIQAAKLGFKDIQFDYVRFAEGFENLDRELSYSFGHYGDDSEELISMESRNQAITDFVKYAQEKLQPYDVDVSVDIFGYAAVVRETPGIGQSFPEISRNVDVISSMIYPSHWGLGNLGIAIPDLEPYNIVNNYVQIEQDIFDELGDEAPVSRPWIQDFTASYLGAGYYKPYGSAEVTDQVRALADNGINEFLLWDAGNTYSEGATYSFD